jgi:TM2 domain-containing membrane protein YozV
MGALDTLAKGALNQFGREFGRAAANTILRGQNSQKIELTDKHTGRIKPTDSPVIRAIKNIQKIEFVIQDKANASRLVEITDEFINVNKFNGIDTLTSLHDFYVLADIYNDKYAHGTALISDDFNDKVMDFLETKRTELTLSMASFNQNCKLFITEQLNFFNQKRIVKSKLVAWSFPIWGILGIHNFYLGKPGKAIFQFLFCWTLILPLLNIIEFLSVLSMNTDRFDSKYNPEFVFFRQFDVSQ